MRERYQGVHEKSAPSWLGMLMYNDLLVWAQQNIDADQLQDVFRYAEAFSSQFAHRVHAALPLPTWEDPAKVHKAERVAQHILESGTGTLWGSSRLV